VKHEWLAQTWWRTQVNERKPIGLSVPYRKITEEKQSELEKKVKDLESRVKKIEASIQSKESKAKPITG